MDEVCEGCMALDNHAGVQRDSELRIEIGTPLGFVLTASIGQENEGDVFGLEEGKSL